MAHGEWFAYRIDQAFLVVLSLEPIKGYISNGPLLLNSTIGNHEIRMPRFSFRLRFRRSPTVTLNIDTPQWEYRLNDATPPLVLCSQKKEEPIKDSNHLIFKSEGWASEEDAAIAAAKYSDALKLSLARLRIGADFGTRQPKSGFTHAGLEMLEAKTGRRVMNDTLGIIVFESELQPLFVSAQADILIGVPQDRFERVLSYAIYHPRPLTDRERLSLDLFNASFFQKSPESRFIMLVMAVEALLELAPRPPKAKAHVETLIRTTQESDSLSDEERNSLLGSLKWLLDESINQAGRRLAESRLGVRVYAKKSAPSFFSYCYDLRSRLVHGKYPLLEQGEIGSAAAQLEVFVSDLLSGQLLEIKWA